MNRKFYMEKWQEEVKMLEFNIKCLEKVTWSQNLWIQSTTFRSLDYLPCLYKFTTQSCFLVIFSICKPNFKLFAAPFTINPEPGLLLTANYLAFSFSSKNSPGKSILRGEIYHINCSMKGVLEHIFSERERERWFKIMCLICHWVELRFINN